MAESAGPSANARARKGILFGHTYLAQSSSPSKSVLCALPAAAERAECACCAGMPSLASLEERAVLHTETTAGLSSRTREIARLEGCDDYQLFWD